MRTRTTTTHDDQALVYKAASVLLQYPDDRVYGALDDITAALHHVHVAAQRKHLVDVVGWLRGQTPSQAAQHHVATFDLKRRCSPYLTYYRYGDTRQRGMALLALKHTYRRVGLEFAGKELPDYLPAVLEFAALAPDGIGTTLLNTHRPGLELLRLALHDTNSAYASVLDAVCAGMSSLTDRQTADVRRLAADGPPKEDVGLDPIGSQPFAPPGFLTGAGMGTPR
jgi:nitrate reductase molybdenum cofactor assembly chaperone NarJ/NarW